MSTILFFILAFFIQAIALKMALGLLGQAKSDNQFSTALAVAAMLNVAMVITTFIPFFGDILKPMVWLLIIMAIYKIGFFKSIAVAVVQLVIAGLLEWILELIGFQNASGLG